MYHKSHHPEKECKENLYKNTTQASLAPSLGPEEVANLLKLPNYTSSEDNRNLTVKAHSDQL